MCSTRGFLALMLREQGYRRVSYSPKFGQGPKVDSSCRKRQTWGYTEDSSARR